MSMFDQITVDYKKLNGTFQTKAFKNLMWDYKITNQGYLLKQPRILVEDKENPMGVSTRSLSWKHMINYNGSFRFYKVKEIYLVHVENGQIIMIEKVERIT